MRKNNLSRVDVLLVSLPFWTPLIPPLGLACLKSHLQPHGFLVKTIDTNVEDRFKELYQKYFNCLNQWVPHEKKGNFFSIGHDVLRNQLMAHLHYDKEAEYIQLVKILVEKTYFCQINDSEVEQLKQILDEFYRRLQTYFLDLLKKSEPTVLGISTYSDTLPAALSVFRLTKERYPHITTVMGGGIFADQLAVGSPNLESFLQKTEPYIDKIIVGEGEELFLKLLKGELPGNQRVFTLKDIDNRYLDLSTAGVPDFSDFPLEYYPYMTAYTSRSCPFQCSFCAETINWGKYRKKNIPQCVKELAFLYETYGYRVFLIGDSLLNPIITELAGAITEKELPIYWDGYFRVDPHACNIDNTLLWRKGGFYRARLGIESGSPHVLKEMGKKITPEQIKEAVSSLAYAGIKTTTYWIIGYPGETEADFQQTLNLVEELKNSIYEAECKPFYYFLTGQVKSREWLGQYKRIQVYPETAADMLMLRTWMIDCPPPREETYKRISRFIQHCRQLGIPNPYTLKEIYQADERWRKMHKNAVPSLVELREKNSYAHEKQEVKKFNFAQNKWQDETNDDFGF